MIPWFNRLMGYLRNQLLVLLSCLSFPVALREDLVIPAFPVIYSGFYGNLASIRRFMSGQTASVRIRTSAASLAFSILYQAESAFINLVLLKIGTAIRALSFLYRKGYYSAFDRFETAGTQLYLFHNYIGARTGILFYIIRSIVRGENNVLFADPQVFRLIRSFKKSLRHGGDPTDTDGKTVIANRDFPLGPGGANVSGEQVILNTASTGNLISAAKYLKKNYRFLIIPESRTGDGRAERISMLGNGLKVPEGARWLAKHSFSPVSVLPGKLRLFIPSAKDFRFEPVISEHYERLYRNQEDRILKKPYLYMPFLHSQMWDTDTDGNAAQILVKMKWKKRRLVFYSGGKVGIIGVNGN